MFIIYIVSFVACFNGIYGLTASTGKCPEAKPIDNLIVDRMMGKWYEWSRSLPNFYESGYNCVNANITEDPDHPEQFMLITLRMFSNDTRVESQIMLNATIDSENCANNGTCGRLKVSTLKPDGTEQVKDYTIVAIQYSSHMVLINCKDLEGNNHMKEVVIVGRRPHPGDSVINSLQSIIKTEDGDNVEYEMTDQHPYCSDIYHDQQSSK